MADKPKNLTIKDWQKGIAASPHQGNGLLRNLDIEAFPGAVKLRPQLKSYFAYLAKNLPTTFTVNTGTNIATAAATLLGTLNYSGTPVTFTTTGTLPAGLSLNTVYFLFQVSSNTFQVAASYQNSAGSAAGTVITITGTGTGVHTVNAVSPGSVRFMRQDPRTNNQFFLDSSGQVWFCLGYSVGNTNLAYLLTGNPLTNANGNGMELFTVSDVSATYLFVFRNHNIDVINVFGVSNIESFSWNPSPWAAVMSTAAGTNNPHPSNVSSRNPGFIYYGDGNVAGSIIEIAGQVFSPASSSTYLLQQGLLKFPAGEVIGCTEELPPNQLFGGLSSNKIYSWDTNAVSYNSFVIVPESGVYGMKNAGNTVYILAGTRGNIYYTQGTFAEFFVKIPDYVLNNDTSVTPSPVTWGGIALRNNAIVVGVGTATAGNSGVFLVYLKAGINGATVAGAIVQDNTPSTGATNPLSILATSDFYVIGYAGGADYHSTARYAQGTLAGVFQSELFRVGDKTHQAKYSQVEIQTAKPAATGEMQLSWRPDDVSAWTSIPGGLFTADGTTRSFQADAAGLVDLENIQVQIQFDGDFEVMEARLNP